MIILEGILNKITTLADKTLRLYVDLPELESNIVKKIYEIYLAKEGNNLHLIILDEEEMDIFRQNMAEIGIDNRRVTAHALQITEDDDETDQENNETLESEKDEYKEDRSERMENPLL